jgi:hypothetical protein
MIPKNIEMVGMIHPSLILFINPAAETVDVEIMYKTVFNRFATYGCKFINIYGNCKAYSCFDVSSYDE